MTIHRIKGARVFFDNKLVGIDGRVELAAGPGSEAFSDDVKAAITVNGKNRMSFDFEANITPHGMQVFENWAGIVKRDAAMAALRELAGRFQPFEFDRPLMYHGDMMRNESDRRFMVVKPSATGKSEHSLGVYGARLMRPANVGKTEAATVLHDRLIREMSNFSFGKFGRPRLPQQRNTGIHAIVKHICANWGNYK